MQTMTDQDPAAKPTFAQIPPIPLVSGDTFRTDDEAAHPIESITVTITGTDGASQQINLEYRFGGWWVPED